MSSQYYPTLQQTLHALGPVPPAAWEAIAERLHEVHCRWGRSLPLGHGKLFFLLEGLIKEEADNGREVHIQQFVRAGDFFTKPTGNGQFVAIEDTTAVAITRQDLYALNRLYPELMAIHDGIISGIQQQLITRIKLLLLPKRERYAAFQRLFPGLAAHLLDKDVMAYLDISPGYFSRNK